MKFLVQEYTTKYVFENNMVINLAITNFAFLFWITLFLEIF